MPRRPEPTDYWRAVDLPRPSVCAWIFKIGRSKGRRCGEVAWYGTPEAPRCARHARASA